MRILGKSPIPLPILIVGKISMFLCWMFFLVRIYDLAPMLFESVVADFVADALIICGLAMVILALKCVGRTATVGLPEQEIRLTTIGPFRFTRNPMYVGGHIVCIGSLLIAPHLLNLFFFALTFTIHHAIILKEEEFLEKSFGEEYRSFTRKVRRYF